MMSAAWRFANTSDQNRHKTPKLLSDALPDSEINDFPFSPIQTLASAIQFSLISNSWRVIGGANWRPPVFVAVTHSVSVVHREIIQSDEQTPFRSMFLWRQRSLAAWRVGHAGLKTASFRSFVVDIRLAAL